MPANSALTAGQRFPPPARPATHQDCCIGGAPCLVPLVHPCTFTCTAHAGTPIITGRALRIHCCSTCHQSVSHTAVCQVPLLKYKSQVWPAQRGSTQRELRTSSNNFKRQGCRLWHPGLPTYNAASVQHLLPIITPCPCAAAGRPPCVPPRSLQQPARQASFWAPAWAGGWVGGVGWGGGGGMREVVGAIRASAVSAWCGKAGTTTPAVRACLAHPPPAACTATPNTKAHLVLLFEEL